MFVPARTPYFCASPADCLLAGGTYLVGIEFDGTACFRKGASAGPAAIREVSSHLESYSPYLDGDLEDITFYDLGNLDRNVSAHAFESLKTDMRLLTLGGDHSISYAPLARYLEIYPDLVVLHLDAHADLRHEYLGERYSHACIMQNVWKKFGDGNQLIQYGIRSGTRQEYQWMREHQGLCTSLVQFLESVESIGEERPIYLTLDLDYFDPAFLPGTGTPEAGGEDFSSFVRLIKILKHKLFVGADVVELAPAIDPTGNSSVFAAKVVREMILALTDRERPT